MKLSEYLEETGMPLTTLAKRADVAYATLRNLINGRNVALNVAVQIQKATKNKVTCLEIYEEFVKPDRNHQ